MCHYMILKNPLTHLFYSNEVEFYTTIMPELLKFQASKTEQDTPVFNAIPKCYSARHDLLIMGNYHS